MPLTKIDPADFIFNNDAVSTSCWRDANGNPTNTVGGTFETINGILNYYNGTPSNLQFSIATADENGSDNEQAIYGAIRNIVYGDKNVTFNWDGYTGRFGVWSISKNCLKYALTPGSLRLGNFTDNSKMSPPTILNCGRAYNIALGAVSSTGVFSYGSGTGNNGLFLPDVGIILITSTGPLFSQFLLSSELATPTQHVFIRARNSQYNYSMNPSFISGSSGKIINIDWHDNPQTYITTVGLYNDNNELMATAKLPRPYNKNFNNELLIQIGLNF